MKPTLVTDVEVGGATTADNTYVESGVKGTEDVTGNKVDTLYCDGAYQARMTASLPTARHRHHYRRFTRYCIEL